MPWKEVEPMDEKLKFVTLARTGRFSLSELCLDHGISRKTGHKYLTRYAESGAAGLQEHSRRPKSSPASTDAAVEALIVKERRGHPSWGPKKLWVILQRDHGIEQPPARSTIGLILKRHGLSQPRGRAPGLYRVACEHLTEPTRPNEVWTVDFKGWFLCGDRQRCDPLTVCDRFSRYVIACHACPNQQYARTRRVFARMLRYHGLPDIIRVDNGAPFASMAWGGLSRLSVWWIEHGIEVEFLTPASPQQNGSHERMHRDLKAEATRPPSANLSAQHKRFQRWRHQYNHIRPHEALDMLTPADVYRPSARRLGERVKITYPPDYVVRKVSDSGHISHEGHAYYLSDIFAGCRVGLFINEEEVIQLHYANLHLGNLTLNDGADPFRPAAYITPPHRKPSTPRKSKKRTTKKV
jgi:transposase InsO family protein